MQSKFIVKVFFILLSVLFLANFAVAQKRKSTSTKPVAPRSLTIVTEPRAVVWLNDLRRGTTDENGQLKIERVSTGTHKLRVRAFGFAEKRQTILPTTRGKIRISLSKTTDEAELSFQEAEFLREGGKDTDKEKSEQLYRRAIELRPRFAEAHVGLARLLTTSDFDEALAQIAEARKIRPNLAEASVVEGRIYRENNDTANAIKSFRRALRESKNIYPEAHTGLALAYQDNGDFANAITEFKAAIAQLDDTEPVVYQLLGEAYERTQRNKEAIAAYERFLALAPNNKQASAVRSIIAQLKLQQNGDTVELMPQ